MWDLYLHSCMKGRQSREERGKGQGGACTVAALQGAAGTEGRAIAGTSKSKEHQIERNIQIPKNKFVSTPISNFPQTKQSQTEKETGLLPQNCQKTT